LSVQGYPPSAYVTQLVVRTLKKNGALRATSAQKISDWAEREINKQVALLSRKEKTADVFQLGYAAILLANLVQPDRITPDQEIILETALAELFSIQREDGTWPLSRPLFHYPSVGSAHCYDYEMLVQLLSEPKLTEKLLRYIPQLAKSAHALNSSFPLPGQRAQGWSSGHHPQFKGPESWSTASVYHFAYSFERLIAEQIRRDTFSYLGSAYIRPVTKAHYLGSLPDAFLDCEVQLDGQTRSLKKVVADNILKPLIVEEKRRTIELGSGLSKRTSMSILFFGPPGTSKTQLADLLAKLLGWPLLPIDASHFLKNGMDGVYAEADRIFGMLAVAERILVLLDEFDEMVRARESATDVLSRFLTTAMLPKLHKINDNRRLAFVVATNHIEAFDIAIRRPGRFDVILQVMPPTVDEKFRKWDVLKKLTSLGIGSKELRTKLTPLTYSETEILVRRLGATTSAATQLKILNATYNSCTLRTASGPGPDSARDVEYALELGFASEVNKTKTWEDICIEQRGLSRVP
jgi:hypothetical protein